MNAFTRWIARKRYAQRQRQLDLFIAKNLPQILSQRTSITKLGRDHIERCIYGDVLPNPDK